jgi:hypothetical protein
MEPSVSHGFMGMIGGEAGGLTPSGKPLDPPDANFSPKNHQ